MNKAKSRQHSRKAARRAALRLKRKQKVNAKKIDRQRRITSARIKRGGLPKETPSDKRRRSRRAAARLAAAVINS